ncbi:MAG: hypothetical protein Q9160_004354 [Pyrenula sp. 1 TL-2023]
MSSTSPFALPYLRETLLLSKQQKTHSRKIFYDVKFNPYQHPSAVPTFAAVGGRDVLIGRTTYKGKTDSIDVLAAYRDDEDDNNESQPDVLNSVCWANIPSSPEIPLLCVAGPSGKIKVLNAITGELTQTLIGHGAEVNDLATHPLHSWIVASASGDNSIRLWSLLPHRASNPCLYILGHGLAHKEPILTCAFHQGGRYILTGGLDHMICLWSIPDLENTIRPSSPPEPEQSNSPSRSNSRRNTPDSSPRLDTSIIYFPHFLTTAVHSNYVDCVAFHGDLILSKACKENKIVLWSITNFSSAGPPLPSSRAPKTHTFRDTRTAFVPDSSTDIPPLSFLLSFSCPHADPFYIRFALLQPAPTSPPTHPILAFSNTNGHILFWDLKRLELGWDDGYRHPTYLTKKTITSTTKDGLLHARPNKRRRGALPPTFTSGSNDTPSIRSLSPDREGSSNRSSSLVSSSTPATSAGTGAAQLPPQQPRVNRKLYDISDPFKPIKPHHDIPLPKTWMTARQVAWSPPFHGGTPEGEEVGYGGRYCVVAGESAENGVLCVLRRGP